MMRTQSLPYWNPSSLCVVQHIVPVNNSMSLMDLREDRQHFMTSIPRLGKYVIVFSCRLLALVCWGILVELSILTARTRNTWCEPSCNDSFSSQNVVTKVFYPRYSWFLYVVAIPEPIFSVVVLGYSCHACWGADREAIEDDQYSSSVILRPVSTIPVA